MTWSFGEANRVIADAVCPVSRGVCPRRFGGLRDCGEDLLLRRSVITRCEPVPELSRQGSLTTPTLPADTLEWPLPWRAPQPAERKGRHGHCGHAHRWLLSSRRSCVSSGWPTARLVLERQQVAPGRQPRHPEHQFDMAWNPALRMRTSGSLGHRTEVSRARRSRQRKHSWDASRPPKVGHYTNRETIDAKKRRVNAPRRAVRSVDDISL